MLHGEIVGVTVCDDVSSRSIEGENPLYLPQAKIFAGACALGPVIRPVWEVEDLHALTLSVSVARDGSDAWAATTSTGNLHRRVEDLAGYLFRGQSHPYGAVLSTGTGLVPELDFSLQTGDVVTIELEGVGALSNVVQRDLAGPQLGPRSLPRPGGRCWQCLVSSPPAYTSWRPTTRTSAASRSGCTWSATATSWCSSTREPHGRPRRPPSQSWQRSAWHWTTSPWS